MDVLTDDLLLECLRRLPRAEQAVARCVCRRLRDALAPPDVYDHRLRAGLLQPWLCVLGGVQKDKGELLAEMLDLQSMRWRPLPAIPPTSFFNLSCAVVGANVYVVGGFAGLSTDLGGSKMCVYKARENTWAEEASQMREFREACACGVIDERIYVAGGYCRSFSSRSNHRVSSGEVYVPGSDWWHPIASMREGRSCCASTVVGGKLYVIGGYGQDSVLTSLEVYDPVQDAWDQSRSGMPNPWILAGCASIGSKIYVVGSDTSAMDVQQLAIYDTVHNMWDLVGAIPFRKLVSGSKCSLWGCAVAATEDKLYVLGGASSYDGGGLSTVLVYDPSQSTWTTSSQMRSRRYSCAAVVVHL